MKTITTGETLDSILQFCLDNEGYNSLSTLQKELLPDLNKDEITLLIGRIDSAYNKIADVISPESNPLIKANGLTKRFLDDGGYTLREQEDESELEQEKRHKELEYKLAESNIRANEINEKVAKRNKTTTIINIILGLINIGLIIWQSLLIVKS